MSIALHPAHPLEPLSAAEIATAVEILKRERPLEAAARFAYITLKEPSKTEVLGHREGAEWERSAMLVLRQPAERMTYEATVSLDSGTVLSWRPLPGAQPPFMAAEFREVQSRIKADPRWREAMRRRGIEDPSLVMVDPWPAGHSSPEDDAVRGRFVNGLSWMRGDRADNGYARPIEGVIARVDLDRMEVVDVEDHGVVPVPGGAANYSEERISEPGNRPRFASGPRADLRPLEITQPAGPSFQVDGHLVSWQKWRFRVGFTPREGLVLYEVEYDDRGRRRPVLYRASVSEMFVPYGDPAPTHYRKNVFDAGEYGLGLMANSLELGCDCLGDIRYFGFTVHDTEGAPVELENAVCLHEEDHGVLWRHFNFRTGTTEVRRSRRLAISSWVTVGNYDYGFFWYLYQDGALEFEVKLTGIVSTGAVAPGEAPAHGSMIAPGVYGPHHQHFFNVRLDTMVDGLENSVYEVDSQPLVTGPANPHGNAWTTRSTLLRSEAEARRLTDQLVGRHWKVTNPSKQNSLGEAVAYRLIPGENVRAMLAADSPALKRAGFIAHHLWVTAYDPDQLFAAGDYPYQNPGDSGLPAYSAADRPLENADLVLWYTFGVHHVVRPEDWPVMPAGHAGFRLQPAGFFDGNPALDVPRPAAQCDDHGQPAPGPPRS
jgi:primary-amine oxidase